MAGRPVKQTVDYFSHDADASEKRTLSILFNHFQHEGISFWWQLLERISKARNHIIEVRNAEDMEYLAAKMHFTTEKLEQMLNKAACLNAIDTELWEHKIIWSQNFVDRLGPVYASRRQELPQRPPIPLPINPIIDTRNSINLPDNTHTKLKETKLKETKEIYGEFENVKLSKTEHQKLVDKYGERVTRDWIEKLSSWLKSNGKSKKDHYATILSWDRRDGNKDARFPERYPKPDEL